jgi:predicted transcriptional regulator
MLTTQVVEKSIMSAIPRQLGRAELEILQFVADHHPIRVGEVARTTVLTVMERLRSKGYLRRKKIGGTWHYSPKIAKSTLLRTLVERFVDESLEGSLSPFMAYLAESESLSDEEFEQLKQLVQELESSRDEKKS